MLSACVIQQIVHIFIQGLYSGQTFPTNGKHIHDKSHFIDKFLKFEEMKYLIHYVWNESNLILCKLSTSFSTVKLKLGPNYSQFIHRFKHNYVYNLNMGLIDDIMLYLQIFPNSPRYFGTFLNVAMARLLNFS